MYVEAYGNDRNNGGVAAPVATIARATEIANAKSANDKCDIIIGSGEYYIDKSIAPQSDNITYCAADNAEVKLSAGVRLALDRAEKVTDEKVLSRLAETEASKNLYSLSLAELEEIPEQDLPGIYKLNWVEYPQKTLEVFYDDKAMTVARYPNRGAEEEYMRVTQVVNEGAVPANWDEKYAGSSDYVPEEERNQNDSFAVVASERAAMWTNAENAVLFGFWKYDWATQSVPLQKVENNVIYSKHPSQFGVSEGARFYIFNLLEEIDSPGEYYIDRENKCLYFYPPEGADMQNGFLNMSVTADPVFNINNVKNTVISGLKIGCARANGIKIGTNAENTTVKDCEIANTADRAVRMDGKNNSVVNCYIHDVDGGVYISGGVRETLEKSGNLVENCEIENFSRLTKVYTPAVEINGVGATVKNNKIHGSEHCAVIYRGNEHEMAYNEIYDVCKETNDAGAIYAGRNWTERGNRVIYNYIHDISPKVVQTAGCAGIFLDDHFAGGYIFGNVFENIQGYGVKLNGGRENTIKNNIFVNCTRPAYMQDISDSAIFADQLAALEDSPYRTELWQTKYLSLVSILEDEKYKEEILNVYADNVAVSCDNEVFTGDKMQEYMNVSNGMYDNFIYESDPGFSDMQNRIYSLREDSIIFEENPDFENIPFKKIGKR